jgi:hypothetical protein
MEEKANEDGFDCFPTTQDTESNGADNTMNIGEAFKLISATTTTRKTIGKIRTKKELSWKDNEKIPDGGQNEGQDAQHAQDAW